MEYDVNKNNKELQNSSKKYFGQWETDRVIETYFEKGYVGKCIDVGAADGKRGSNTYYFEKLGWRCLCIEANPEHKKSLQELRRSVIMQACGNVKLYEEMELQVFRVGDRDISTSITSLDPDKRLVEDHKHIIQNQYSVKVIVNSLTNIIRGIWVPGSYDTIDFISIDTEGTELDVIKGIDFDSFNVMLLVIENNYDDTKISEYLNQLGYIRDQRYKINDFYVRK